jgi:isopentenyl-diphosphate delta-isomerase type 1
MPELFDVVDEQDRVLRQETRAEVHRQRLLHRAVHVLVFNPGGEVYLQRRSPQKDTYPLRWTTSCSGHVDAGEDYDIAVVREMGEELGIKITDVSALVKLLKHGPGRETGWEFIWIYTLTTDAAPAPDPAEIAEGRWSAPAELDAWMAREPKAFTPSFLLVWKLWRGKNIKN